MLNCLFEKTYYEFNELIGVLQVCHVVRALQNKELRNPRLEKFVVLYDLVRTDCAQPVLVTIAESNRKR